MLKTFRSAVSYALVLLTLCSTASLPTASAQAARQDGGQPVPLAKRLPVGVVRGEAARLRVNKLRATNKALDRAIRDKEHAGKHVNWELSATLIFSAGEKRAEQRTLGNALYMNASFSLTPEQSTLSDGTGEATFIYDGDPSTWDGTIYRLDYNTGENEVYDAWMSDYGSIDDPALWDVTDEIYYPPDGGPPVCETPPPDMPAMECGPVSKFEKKDEKNASASASLYRDASYTPAAAGARPVGPIIRWFTRFWRCYSRTMAYRSAACINPQARIRNNLICYLAAGIYAAGCCARFAHYNNYGQGICWQ
jgi:hypothetical protein